MKKKSKDALIFERPNFRTRKSIEGENMLEFSLEIYESEMCTHQEYKNIGGKTLWT